MATIKAVEVTLSDGKNVYVKMPRGKHIGKFISILPLFGKFAGIIAQVEETQKIIAAKKEAGENIANAETLDVVSAILSVIAETSDDVQNKLFPVLAAMCDMSETEFGELYLTDIAAVALGAFQCLPLDDFLAKPPTQTA